MSRELGVEGGAHISHARNLTDWLALKGMIFALEQTLQFLIVFVPAPAYPKSFC